MSTALIFKEPFLGILRLTMQGRAFCKATYSTEDGQLAAFFKDDKMRSVALESFPTPWAQALVYDELTYHTEKLEHLNEWGALLFMRFLDMVTPRRFTSNDIKSMDPELFSALFSTPQAPEATKPIYVLVATGNDRKEYCIGGTHHSCLVFPARDRAGWNNLPEKMALSEGNSLSLQVLLEKSDNETKESFVGHVRMLIQLLKKEPVKKESVLEHFNRLIAALEAIIKEVNLGNGHVPSVEIPQGCTVDNWIEHFSPAVSAASKLSDLVEAYPLKLEKEKILFTVEGIDSQINPWVDENIRSLAGIRLSAIRAGNKGNQIVVGPSNEMDLGEGWKVVKLQTLLLNKHLGIQDTALSDMELVPNAVRDGGFPNATVPVTPYFFKYFKSSEKEIRFNKQSQTWSFKFDEAHTISWVSEPVATKAFDNVLVEVWPPEFSERWGTYFLRYAGVDPEKTYRWYAVSKTDTKALDGEPHLNDPDRRGREYVQVVKGAPIAIVLQNGKAGFGGCIVLDQPDASQSQGEKIAMLAMDFGTTNTCLAYRDAKRPLPLTFDIAPRTLWGKTRVEVDETGWFPRSVAKQPISSYFPTQLWRRLSSQSGGQGNGQQATEVPSLDDYIGTIDLPGLRDTKSWKADNNWKSAGNLKWLDEASGNHGREASGQSRKEARALFIQYALLLAHAQMHFKLRKEPLPQSYVFTYPLAMKQSVVSDFKQKVVEMIAQSLMLVSPACEAKSNFPSECSVVVTEKGSSGSEDKTTINVNFVSESMAMAHHIADDGIEGNRALVIDIGGGSADICVLNKKTPVCLDSVRLAGNRYFNLVCNTIEQDYKGYKETLQHLAIMLHGSPNRSGDVGTYASDVEIFPPAYSLLIKSVPPGPKSIRELQLLESVKPGGEYAAFMLRALLRHLIAYGLVLAAASIFDEIKEKNKEGDKDWRMWKPEITLHLAGNGWGFLPFAQLNLKQLDKTVQDVWKEVLIALHVEFGNGALDEAALLDKIKVKIETSQKLNGEQAKTAVALGATDAVREKGAGEETDLKTFFGLGLRNVTLSNPNPNSSSNAKGEEYKPEHIHWFARFKKDALKSGNTSQWEKIVFPIEAVQNREPMWPLQKALVDMLCVDFTLYVEDDFYLRWNQLLSEQFKEEKILGKEFSKSPLTVLIEQFHQDIEHPDRETRWALGVAKAQKLID